MSPEHGSTESDRQSGKPTRRPGRPGTPREQMLAAAGAAFRAAMSQDAGGPSMDAVAAAAGVGKATLFRAFGDRNGLLDALADAAFEPLRSAVERGANPDLFNPHAAAADRVIAVLDALLAFKLDNIALMRSRETVADGGLGSARYRWTQQLLAGLIAEAAPSVAGSRADYLGHALLATLQIDLLDRLLADGRTRADLSRLQTAHARAILRAQG